MFALAFCIFEISQYHGTVVPAMHRLKFDYWGHDCAVLHEREIRKRQHDFAWLMGGRQRREQFLAELHDQISDAPFRIIASVINKIILRKQYADPRAPITSRFFCLEKLHGHLLKNGQKGRVVNVIFECRGRKEDRALEQFRRISGEEMGIQAGQFRPDDIRATFLAKIGQYHRPADRRPCGPAPCPSHIQAGPAKQDIWRSCEKLYARKAFLVLKNKRHRNPSTFLPTGIVPVLLST